MHQRISAGAVYCYLFTHPCLTPRSGGTRQNFWIKCIPQKLCGESCMILTSTVFDCSALPVWQTDGRTDRR